MGRTLALLQGCLLFVWKISSMNDEDLPADTKKKSSPIAVLLISLFGYPGVGHLMVGARRLGVALILVFTALTVGVLYEIWVMVTPILALYSEGVLLDRLGTQGLSALPMPEWWRIGLWLLGSGVVWLGSGIHSYQLARASQNAPEQ